MTNSRDLACFNQHAVFLELNELSAKSSLSRCAEHTDIAEVSSGKKDCFGRRIPIPLDLVKDTCLCVCVCVYKCI